jgi:MICOS complex subunit MIC12
VPIVLLPSQEYANNAFQLGGVALTSSILYLSVAIHRQNRLGQSVLLSQQNLVLRSIVQPEPPIPPPTAREARAGVIEFAKDRWNGEIEGLVRKVNNTDWNEVRSEWEGKIMALVSRLRESGQGEKAADRREG